MAWYLAGWYYSSRSFAGSYPGPYLRRIHSGNPPHLNGIDKNCGFGTKLYLFSANSIACKQTFWYNIVMVQKSNLEN
ncbi:MAG: hypothetical protein HPY74_10835 [Firmicutes bacterium]|nr:hypothetical protein [Bacillota bacterium]